MGEKPGTEEAFIRHTIWERLDWFAREYREKMACREKGWEKELASLEARWEKFLSSLPEEEREPAESEQMEEEARREYELYLYGLKDGIRIMEQIRRITEEEERK